MSKNLNKITDYKRVLEQICSESIYLLNHQKAETVLAASPITHVQNEERKGVTKHGESSHVLFFGEMSQNRARNKKVTHCCYMTFCANRSYGGQHIEKFPG